jgi:hypothetical protein
MNFRPIKKALQGNNPPNTPHSEIAACSCGSDGFGSLRHGSLKFVTIFHEIVDNCCFDYKFSPAHII